MAFSGSLDSKSHQLSIIFLRIFFLERLYKVISIEILHIYEHSSMNHTEQVTETGWELSKGQLY